MDVEEDDNEQLFCVPGQRLCALTENVISGVGTYERCGYLHASLPGVVRVKRTDKVTNISVSSFANNTIVPVIGDIVTAKISAVTQRAAKCIIVSIGDVCLNRHFRGILRKEEVRATEIDRIDMYKCFRPGDIILARVIHQVELNIYQLTTADNELGVVTAISNNKGPEPIIMVPISWTEVQCPITLVKEARKLARVAPERSVTEITSENF